jgi:hypothetical protein
MKAVIHVNKSDNGPPLEAVLTQQLCEPGRTTNNIVTKMVDIKSGNLLVEKYVKGGIIDSETRKSIIRFK